MDSESIEAVRSVVTEVLNRAGDATDDWAALASAGLLALAVPEEYGGEGLGLDEVGVLLRETGARAVDLPVWETLCCGALTLAATGTEEQRRTWLPGVATGETLLTPALREVGVGITGSPRHDVHRRHGDGPQDRRHPRRRGRPPPGDRPVPATTPWSSLVDPQGPGVQLLPSPSSSGRTQHTVVLDGAPAEPLGAGAAEVLTRHAVAGLALTAAGLVAGARDLTADYIKGRTQFGRALAEFQAVAMQIADVYIASRTDRPGRRQRRLADPRGPRRQRRPRRGGVLDLPGGAEGAADLPPPARRHGRSTSPTRCPATSRGSPTSRTRSERCQATCGSRTRRRRTSS